MNAAKLKTIVVFRHGSNAANQSRRLVAPVFICEATDGEAAKQAAREAGINCYNNQYLSWEFASRCKAAERQEALEVTEARKIDKLADQHEADCYEEEGEAAYGRED